MSMVHFCQGLGLRISIVREERNVAVVVATRWADSTCITGYTGVAPPHYMARSFAPSREFRDRAHHWERASVYGTHNVS